VWVTALGWYVPVSVLVIRDLLGQAMFIAFIAIHMNVCWERVAATQFAIYTAWANLARSISGLIYARVEHLLDAGDERLIIGVVSAIGGALVALVRLQQHRRHLAYPRRPEARTCSCGSKGRGVKFRLKGPGWVPRRRAPRSASRSGIVP
jgi:NADPH:quinone reductase-like Zn-dependent oxidoreductase